MNDDQKTICSLLGWVFQPQLQQWVNVNGPLGYVNKQEFETPYTVDELMLFVAENRGDGASNYVTVRYDRQRDDNKFYVESTMRTDMGRINYLHSRDSTTSTGSVPGATALAALEESVLSLVHYRKIPIPTVVAPTIEMLTEIIATPPPPVKIPVKKSQFSSIQIASYQTVISQMVSGNMDYTNTPRYKEFNAKGRANFKTYLSTVKSSSINGITYGKIDEPEYTAKQLHDFEDIIKTMKAMNVGFKNVVTWTALQDKKAFEQYLKTVPAFAINGWCYGSTAVKEEQIPDPTPSNEAPAPWDIVSEEPMPPADDQILDGGLPPSLKPSMVSEDEWALLMFDPVFLDIREAIQNKSPAMTTSVVNAIAVSQYAVLPKKPKFIGLTES